MVLVELRQKKGEAWKQARDLLEKAETENRALNTEEQTKWDEINKGLDELNKRIAAAERAIEMDREVAALQIEDGRAQPTEGTPGQQKAIEYRGYEFQRHTTTGTREYRDAYRAFLREGRNGLTQEETRALSMGIGTQGGYSVMPQEIVTELLIAMDNEVFVRRFAKIHPPLTNAASLGRISLDADPAVPVWTSELQTGDEDTSMAFGKRELRPHPLAKRIKVSRTLLRTSFLNIESIIRGRFTYQFGVTMENAYLTGDGVQKPLGVFFASPDGIPVSRDVSTDNTATAITADGLINAKFSLKTQYWPRARWLFHRDAIKSVRKLKDTMGQYIWQPGLVGNIPDRIIETPYDMSEYVPNTFTTGLYVGIIGDWQFYEIVDALSMEMQRVDELYAETNQVGFITRYEGDGMPTLSEAFARVKLG